MGKLWTLIAVFLSLCCWHSEGYPCYGVCECNAVPGTAVCNVALQSTVPAFYYLPNIDKLTINGNRLVTNFQEGIFPRKVFKQMEIYNTSVSQLPCTLFEELESKLYVLRFDGHGFRSVPQCAIATLKELRVFKLSRGPLASLENGDFTGQLNFLELDLSYNEISNINVRAFKEMSRLKRLVLRGNRLSELKPRQFDGLGQVVPEWLDLSYNEIEVISGGTFDGFGSGLHGLDLSYNRITQSTWPQVVQTFPYFPELWVLNISGNALGEVNEKLFQESFPELFTLGISNCSVPSSSLEELQKIGKVDISSNNISREKVTFVSSNYTCDSTSKGGFDCSTVIFNISDNSFKTIEAVHGFAVDSKRLVISAEHADLERVLVLTTSSTSKVQKPDLELYLSGNEIQTPVEIQLLGGDIERLVINLHLADNNMMTGLQQPLKVFQFSANASKLTEIHLCELFIQNVTVGLLDLSGNRITGLPEELCFITNIEILKLNRNSIKTIDFSKVKGAVSMREIELRKNKIDSLAENAFASLTSLERIDLRENRLRTLPDISYLQGFVLFSRLLLNGNPLYCDCSLARLQIITRLYPAYPDHDIDYDVRVSGRCSEPPEFEGFNPLCFSLGTNACPTLDVDLYVRYLWLGCQTDTFTDIKNYSVSVENNTDVFVKWRTIGPGRLHGYQISYHGPSLARTVLFVPHPNSFVVIEDLVGDNITVCLTALPVISNYRQEKPKSACASVRTIIESVKDPTILALAIALGGVGVVLIALLFTLCYCRKSSTKNEASVRHGYATADYTNHTHRYESGIDTVHTDRDSYLEPLPSLPSSYNPNSNKTDNDEDVYTSAE